jgi:hypothetical protein
LLFGPDPTAKISDFGISKVYSIFQITCLFLASIITTV